MKNNRALKIATLFFLGLFIAIIPAEASTTSLFEPYVTFPAGSPQAVGTGDFNNDGRMDVAVTNNEMELKIFTQNASGGLNSAVTYAAGTRPESLAVGDLNNDGRDDIVVTNSNDNTISIFLQQEDGTMADRVTHSTGSSPDAVAVGDVNGDDLDDVVVANWNSPFISVFIQNNDGTLDAKVDYASPQAGYDDIAIGDVNGDGRNDVVKMNGQLYANPDLSVYIQSDNGTLNAAVSYSLPGNILGKGIGIGDVTGDGLADVVMSYGGNRPNSYIAVFAQAENGSLQSSVSYAAYDIPVPVEITDVNSDGLADVITAHSGWNRVSVYLQQNNGTLGSYTLYALPNNSASHYKPQGLVLGDVNSDDLPDILVANLNYGLNVLYHAKKPSAFNKTSPTDGIADQPLSVTLAWGSSGNAVRYEYCYDTTNDNNCTPWVNNGTATHKTLSGLALGTTYYWHVRSLNGIGTTYSNGSETAYWSFTTAVPPTYVINTNDSGLGSLRQAIANASDGETITFAPHLAGESIHLASTLEIDKAITIDGSALNPRITLSGDTDDDGVGDMPIMGIGIGGAVKISNVDFVNGKNESHSLAGGINNFGGNLEVEKCTFSGNKGDFGGAILNKGSLTIQNCEFLNNSANDGGAILNDFDTTALISNTLFAQNAADNEYGAGGAIANIGILTITQSEFNENTAAGGGAIANAWGGTITISETVFIKNAGTAEGGGAVYNTESSMTIADASFLENTTFKDGGVIFNIDGTIGISNSEFNGNTAAGDGGAIYNQGTMEVIKSTVANNSAEMGGGIANIGTLTITNSNILENSVASSYGGGGGILNFSDPDNSGILSFTNSTISSNTAPSGGGILNLAPAGEVTISNSTVSNNTVSDTGGGVSNFGILTMENSTVFDNSATYGGGIANHNALTMINNTFSDNSADNGGGIYNGGSLSLINNILANSATGGDCSNHELHGVITANINNLVENNAPAPNHCGTPAFITDPKLGTLADNGGPTRTMALLFGSPAFDAGDNTSCRATDQRGVTRPQGAGCDIGAYERISITNPTFSDVPFNHSAWQYIEAIYNAGITGGCTTTPLNYCPNNTVTRAQMAIFLLRGIHGSSYTPPAVGDSTGFNDVPTTHSAATWIKQLAAEGITGGCGNGNYCPNQAVTRAQMAIFLLRAKYGDDYVPPAVGGSSGFNDVPAGSSTAPWIKQLAAEGITGGCGNGNFCPNNPVTRSQMAIFLQRAFNLPLP